MNITAVVDKWLKGIYQTRYGMLFLLSGDPGLSSVGSSVFVNLVMIDCDWLVAGW